MSDLIYNFGQTANKGNPLTNLGGQFADMINQKRAAEAAALAQARYDAAGKAYVGNPTDRNAIAEYYAAAEGVGQFDNATKIMSGISSADQKNKLNLYGSGYSAILGGDFETAANKWENDALAFENDNDPTNDSEIARLRNFAKLVREGKGNEVLTMLGPVLSMLEGGTDLLDSVYAGKQEGRDQEQHIFDQITAGMALEAGSEKFRNFAMSVGAKLGGQLGRDFASLAQLTSGEKGFDQTKWVNDTFFKRSEPLRIISTSNAGVQAAVQTAIATQGGTALTWVDDAGVTHEVPGGGVADLTAINLFQRIIDDATVRESDISNLAKTADIKGKLSNFMNSILKGTKLTDDQRMEMAAMANELEKVAANYVDTQVYPALSATQKNRGLNYEESFGGFIPPEDRVEGQGYFKKTDVPGAAPAKEVKLNSIGLTPEQNTTLDDYWVKNYGSSDDIKGKTREEILAMDPKAFDALPEAAIETKAAPIVDIIEGAPAVAGDLSLLPDTDGVRAALIQAYPKEKDKIAGSTFEELKTGYGRTLTKFLEDGTIVKKLTPEGSRSDDSWEMN